MVDKRKKFTLFRKQCFNTEELGLEVQPMMINRLNRLVATGMFGNSVEEAAIFILGLGIAQIEKKYGPWNDLIDTRGHPKPEMLYPNSDEVLEKATDHQVRRKALRRHDELETKRQLWAVDPEISQEDYNDLTAEILAIRSSLNLPDPTWVEKSDG